MGVCHWGDSGRGRFDPHSIGDFLNGNWFGGVDVGDGVGNRSSHDNLASEVNQSILVSALRSKGAKDLWGQDCVPKGRSKGPTGRPELPWVAGAARRDKKLHSDSCRGLIGRPVEN